MSSIGKIYPFVNLEINHYWGEWSAHRMRFLRDFRNWSLIQFHHRLFSSFISWNRNIKSRALLIIYFFFSLKTLPPISTLSNQFVACTTVRGPFSITRYLSSQPSVRHGRLVSTLERPAPPRGFALLIAFLFCGIFVVERIISRVIVTVNIGGWVSSWRSFCVGRRSE